MTQEQKSLAAIIEYLWEDEKTHFQETYEVEIQSQDTLADWILTCKEKGYDDHIFYHLLVMRAELMDTTGQVYVLNTIS